MKKLLFPALAVLFLFFLSACGGVYAETVHPDCGVSLTPTEVAAAGMKYTVQNTLKAEVSCGPGSDCSVQVLRNGKWYPVSPEGSAPDLPPEIWYCPEGTSVSFAFYWGDYFGLLPAGSYRIVKTVQCKYSDGSTESFNLPAEFTIS